MVLLLIIALLPLWHGASMRFWALKFCGVFIVVALTAPTIPMPLKRLWSNLGFLLGHIVSPIALDILFYGVVATIGLLVRLLGKVPLRLKLNQKASTY